MQICSFPLYSCKRHEESVMKKNCVLIIKMQALKRASHVHYKAISHLIEPLSGVKPCGSSVLFFFFSVTDCSESPSRFSKHQCENS